MLVEEAHGGFQKVLPYRNVLIVIDPPADRERGAECQRKFVKWSLTPSSAGPIEKKHVQVGHIGMHTNNRNDKKSCRWQRDF